MQIEKRAVADLKAADYNPRKDLQPGMPNTRSSNAVFKNSAMSNQSFGTSARG